MPLVDGYVRSPLSGLVPWVLMAAISGPGRFEEAASAALGLALLTLWIGVRRGVPVHALEVFGVAYFGVMAVLGLVASDGVISWLELWAGELSNIALAAFAVTTLLIRRPFTLAYAKDTTDPEHWDSPLFGKVNYAISTVWAGAFLCCAIAGAVGDVVLHDNNEFWTAWILPLAAILGAVAFTEFYPDFATAKFTQAQGETAVTAPSIARLFDGLPPFILVTGIAGWVSDALPDALGIALIVIGIVGSAALRKLLPESAAPKP